jgi:ABC-2 type transport system ATP-binding protein
MIKIEGFKKTFYVGFRRRPSVATKGISFSVEKGEIFGFLGPNGSGKTTTIKALLGLIRPDEGRLSLVGHPSDSMGWRDHVGYLPEHPTFYEFLTGFELVSWFGTLSGLSRHESETAAKKHLSRVGLDHALHRRLRGYSKGMFQRTGLAQALIGDPQLLILDEPMTGLDPMGRKEIRELILDLREEGRTVFYSTHILPDVEMTCDRVAIVNKGELQRVGKLEDILSETTRGISVRMCGLSAEALSKIAEEHSEAVITEAEVQLEFEVTEEARAFVAQHSAAGATLEKFEPHRDDLETIFVRSLGAKEAQS